ncbi:17065_t:CDS:1, partial [Funneliformis caledonium]
YDTWYLKEELREIIHNVINKVKNLNQQNFEKYLKIVDIPLKVSDYYYFIRFIFPNDDCAVKYPIVKLSEYP